MVEPVQQGTAKKPAKSWEELYDRMLRELGIHAGFRSGGS